MFDVLVYLYENYWRPDACPDHDQLSRKLSAVGFETDEIQEALVWLDGLLGSKPFIAGNKLTLADIHLFAFVDFMGNVGQPLSPDCKNLTAWYGRMKARPSAAASMCRPWQSFRRCRTAIWPIWACIAR